MAKKKGRMPIRRKGALPGPRAKILKKVVGDPVKDIYLPAANKHIGMRHGLGWDL